VPMRSPAPMPAVKLSPMAAHRLTKPRSTFELSRRISTGGTAIGEAVVSVVMSTPATAAVLSRGIAWWEGAPNAAGHNAAAATSQIGDHMIPSPVSIPDESLPVISQSPRKTGRC
jgi:hypothetical protein